MTIPPPEHNQAKADSADHPGVIAPPPLILLASISAAILVQYFLPEIQLQIGWLMRHILALILVMVGVGLEISAFLAFRKAKTNVAPWKPAKALAPDGPYRFTRNPMYLGMALLHIGIAVYLNSPIVLAMAVVFVFIIHFGVIIREERYLTAKFGEDYLSYKRRIRRWL
jgi:protein-S-isoprenylcysteine O-methyltransferase Ste14